MTAGVTCSPSPGETEAMSHQRGSLVLILLLSRVLHWFHSNSCFTGRKERILAVLGSTNLEPVGFWGTLRSAWFQAGLVSGLPEHFHLVWLSLNRDKH